MKKIIILFLSLSILFTSGCIKEEIITYKILPTNLENINKKYGDDRVFDSMKESLVDKRLTSYALLDLGSLTKEINVCINTYVYHDGWQYNYSEQIDESHGPKDEYGIVLLGTFLYKDSHCNKENRYRICTAEAAYEEGKISSSQLSEGTLRQYVTTNNLKNRREIVLEDSLDVKPYEEQILMAVVYSENDTSKITLDNVLEQTDLQYGVLCTITLYKQIIGSPYLPEEDHF